MKCSIIVTFKNEEDCLSELYHRVVAVFRQMNRWDFEFIFIDDCSTDSSLSILEQVAFDDDRVKVFKTARNFGLTPCILAGMKVATGDCAVVIDADLQDPPEVIPQLLFKWEEGFKVVHTKRLSREGEGAVKMFCTRVAYLIIDWINSTEASQQGDFKLYDPIVIKEIIEMNDPNIYLRGASRYAGYEQAIVEYHRDPRLAGETKFNILKTTNPFKELIRGITSFTFKPIYLFGIVFFSWGLFLLINMPMRDFSEHYEKFLIWDISMVLIMFWLSFFNFYLVRLGKKILGFGNAKIIEIIAR